MNEKLYLTLTLIASFRVCTGAEEPDGLRLCEDGELRYYRDGRPVYAGVVEQDGSLYYINSTCKAVRSVVYDIGAGSTNGLCGAGRYTADENGVERTVCEMTANEMVFVAAVEEIIKKF